MRWGRDIDMQRALKNFEDPKLKKMASGLAHGSGKRKEKSAMRYRLKENAFGRFVLMHSSDDTLGWTGSAWAPMDEYGLPSGHAQIANFSDQAEANEYAEAKGWARIS